MLTSDSTSHIEAKKTLIARRELVSNFLLCLVPSEVTHLRLLSVSKGEHFKSLSSLPIYTWYVV